MAHAELTNPNAIATKLTLKSAVKNFIVFHRILLIIKANLFGIKAGLNFNDLMINLQQRTFHIVI